MSHKNKDYDLEKIKQLIDIMKKNDLIEIEIGNEDDKILLKRANPHQVIHAVPFTGPASPSQKGASAAVPSTEAMHAEPDNANLELIKSPIVGTFYSAPSPESEPFVDVGTKVESDSIVCIVEAMKVMNEIKAEIDGKIVEILAKNGQAVEYGQVLFKVKPE